jgi:hypothetical protein
MRYLSNSNTQTARRTGVSALLLGLLLLSSCATPSSAPGRARFAEAEDADFIARYYTDQTSYAVKPAAMDGSYQSICDRATLLKLAREQPRRELAVVMLIHYQSDAAEEPVKVAWVNDLTALGYRRVVFLRSSGSMQANGLPVLDSPRAPATFAGK